MMNVLAESFGVADDLRKILKNKETIKKLEEENDRLFEKLYSNNGYILKTIDGYKTFEVGKAEGKWVRYREFDFVKYGKTTEKDKKYYGLHG